MLPAPIASAGELATKEQALMTPPRITLVTSPSEMPPGPAHLWDLEFATQVAEVNRLLDLFEGLLHSQTLSAKLGRVAEVRAISGELRLVAALIESASDDLGAVTS